MTGDLTGPSLLGRLPGPPRAASLVAGHFGQGGPTTDAGGPGPPQQLSQHARPLGADVETGLRERHDEPLPRLRTHEERDESAGSAEDVLDPDVLEVHLRVADRDEQPGELARAVGDDDADLPVRRRGGAMLARDAGLALDPRAQHAGDQPRRLGLPRPAAPASAGRPPCAAGPRRPRRARPRPDRRSR